MSLCIGLFGTCDNSDWRKTFIETYDAIGIPYFNPMVENWTSALADVERDHLANDDIVLFPVLGWSLGQGSLSELGFGPLRAMRQNKNRMFVFYIEQELHERLNDVDPDRRKDSLRSRKLVKAHLEGLDDPNVYIVHSLDAMLQVSCDLYRGLEALYGARKSAARR